MAIREWEDGPGNDDIRPEPQNKNIAPNVSGDVGTGDDKWGNLYLSEDAHIDGDANIGQDANVTGNANVGGDVDADGDVKAGTDLYVEGQVRTSLRRGTGQNLDLGTQSEKWSHVWAQYTSNNNRKNITYFA